MAETEGKLERLTALNDEMRDLIGQERQYNEEEIQRLMERIKSIEQRYKDFLEREGEQEENEHKNI